MDAGRPDRAAQVARRRHFHAALWVPVYSPDASPEPSAYAEQDAEPRENTILGRDMGIPELGAHPVYGRPYSLISCERYSNPFAVIIVV